MSILYTYKKLCQGLKPISISLSPNTEKDDIRLALKLIFRPWRWKRKLIEAGFLSTKLEEEFKEYLGVNTLFLSIAVGRP